MTDINVTLPADESTEVVAALEARKAAIALEAGRGGGRWEPAAAAAYGATERALARITAETQAAEAAADLDPRGCRYVVSEQPSALEGGNVEGSDTLARTLDLVRGGLEHGHDVAVTLAAWAR